jgi:hypothetical protein
MRIRIRKNIPIIDREQNILNARYLPVNRLASKCIQRLGLNSISEARGVFDGECLSSKRHFHRPVFEISKANRQKFEGRTYLLAVCR